MHNKVLHQTINTVILYWGEIQQNFEFSKQFHTL